MPGFGQASAISGHFRHLAGFRLPIDSFRNETHPLDHSLDHSIITE